MSHQAAIYDVISDGTTSLVIGGDVDHDFAIGLNTNADVGIRSVLSFMVDFVNPNSLQGKRI